jgi:hypothetical protein
MKVIIHQTDKYGETLLERYPVLEKYKDDYIPKIDYDDPDFNFGDIPDYYCWNGDCIVVYLNQFEIIQLVEELIKEESVIIKHSDSYDHEKYDLDIDIEIYNDMRE